MTDEMTGGKPLMGRITFGPGEPEKPTLASLISSGYGGALAKLMEADATHTTIPTAALTELLAAAEECAGKLEAEVVDRFPRWNANPVDTLDARCYERDMTPVRRLRAAVARVRGE